MQFKISRESSLKPLQLVSGVVEKRQTLPVLSNVLLVLEGDNLSLTGTDLEVELVGRVRVDESKVSGAVTVPGQTTAAAPRSRTPIRGGLQTCTAAADRGAKAAVCAV